MINDNNHINHKHTNYHNIYNHNDKLIEKKEHDNYNIKKLIAMTIIIILISIIIIPRTLTITILIIFLI